MLVSTMTDLEVTHEVLSDYEYITESFAGNKMVLAYYKERKKKKISSEASYPKFYYFKTKRKNAWFLLIQKQASLKKYKTANDSDYVPCTYYYTNKGLRVFLATSAGPLLVFNGHVFSRYRERMNIPISDSKGLIEHFFLNCDINTYRFFPFEKDEAQVIGFINGGFLMGSIKKSNMWINFKTFISKNLAGGRISKNESDLFAFLRYNLKKAKEDEDQARYQEMITLFRGVGLVEDNNLEASLEKFYNLEIDESILNEYDDLTISMIK